MPSSNDQRGTSRHSEDSDLAEMMVNSGQLHDNDNPLWLGPCAEGWNGGVTQSMIGWFLNCRERFRLKTVLGLFATDKWNHRFGYGNMWHRCEEGLASEDSNWEDNLVGHVAQMSLQYPFQRDEIEKWWQVCRVQFPEYIKFWDDHPDVKNRTPLLQEQVFDVPYQLPSGRTVRLRGRWDSGDLIEAHTDESGQQWPTGIWLQENKTKGEVDRSQIERQLRFDLQTLLYLVALTESQTPESIPALCAYPILGVRYNVVRRPLSGGWGTITKHKAKQNKAKRTFTPAETDEEFYERLRRDYIAKEPSHFFFRVKAGISQRDMRVFRETCLDPILEQMCWWYDQVRYGIQFRECPPLNYRMPYGVYSPLQDGGETEYDGFLETGSEVGLRRVEELFGELK